MGISGLQWGLLQIPLGAGLNQKGDARASNPPALDICTDAEFDEIGGLQTRYPFAAIGNSIHGGGTISNARKLVANGSELLCFTEDSLYSWSPRLSAWINKGTHLACKIDEATVFATTGDQVECDRAELNGTVIYAWREGDTVYAAARDKTTGSVLVAPTSLGVCSRPRLVATSTRILLFTVEISELVVRAINPADVASGLASTATVVLNSLGGGTFDSYYDVERVPGTDQAIGCARMNPTTTYAVFSVDAALTIATSSKARTSTIAMAIACEPTGTTATIVRYGGFIPDGILADAITIATLADGTTATAIGSDAGYTSITAAYRSTQDGGAYRCYVFWTEEGSSASFNTVDSGVNWIDTNGSTGSASSFVRMLGLGSRAFSHNGRVYVWTSFGYSSGFVGTGGGIVGNLQNAYFLYRDDAFLVGKAVSSRGGGYATTGHLPGVTAADGSSFAWCATERRRIEVGPGEGNLGWVAESYSMHAPCDVSFTFDSNEARRCARIGQTLYIAGGEALQYDGRQLTEIGFHTAPYWFDLSAGTPAGGTVADGTYGYQLTWRWLNARGERDRSTSGVIGTFAVSGGPLPVIADSVFPLTITHKTAPDAAVEVWRTAVNPTPDAPFYLATSLDPTDTSGTNHYIANDPSVDYFPQWEDGYPDATLTTKETHPETGGILENLAPPACSIVIANESRLFLAGIAGRPDTVWYSKLRGDGEVCAFHDALTIAVPPEGGAITGLAFLNETLIVFRERAAYAFPGEGYGNDGSGSNYGPARTLSIDVGAVNAESIATIADGSLLFKSSKGWYVLNRGWGLDYVGAPVVDYDAEEPLAVHVLTNRHQIRILTSERMLVWDYLVNQWGEWTISDGISAAMWNGTHHYLTSTEIKAEQSTYSGVDYGMDIETAWIKLGDQMQSIGRVRRLLMLGEYQSDHVVRIRVARDYKATASEAWDYFDDTHWTVAPTTVGGPEQVRIGPSQQQCQAIKIRITVRRSDGAGGYTTPNGAALKISGLALEVGQKRGPYSMLPAAQKT